MRAQWMRSLVGLLALVGCGRGAWAIAGPDFYTYEALIDSDLNPGTGCDVMLHDANFSGTVTGIEYIVSADVGRLPATATVFEINVRRCLSGSAFGPFQTVVTSAYAVGQDNGVNGADVVEFFVPLADIGNPTAVRLAFHASRNNFNDVLLTTNGQESGAPIIFRLSGVEAPALSGLALLLTVALLFAVASWRLRRRAPLRTALLSVALLGTLVMTAWAVTIALDGDVADWASVPRAGTDPMNDSSIGDPAEDILAAFVTADAQNLYFRMDQKNLIPVVCGNGVIESGESCESASDCTPPEPLTDAASAAALPPNPCMCQACQCVCECQDVL